jgi:uncharacterized protein with HEPN domain
MSAPFRIGDILEHMAVALEKIGRYTDGLSPAGFYEDEKTQDAVIRNIEILGEAANNIQKTVPAFAQQYPSIPWAVLYAMRNRVAHGYWQVDVEIVWQTIMRDFPILRHDLAVVRQSLARENTMGM